MAYPTFREYLAEKYGINASGHSPGQAMANAGPKVVKPSKPVFGGVKSANVFGKPPRKKSGIVGEK